MSEQPSEALWKHYARTPAGEQHPARPVRWLFDLAFQLERLAATAATRAARRECLDRADAVYEVIAAIRSGLLHDGRPDDREDSGSAYYFALSSVAERIAYESASPVSARAIVRAVAVARRQVHDLHNSTHTPLPALDEYADLVAAVVCNELVAQRLTDERVQGPAAELFADLAPQSDSHGLANRSIQLR